jgi:hypothetical protein
MERSRFGLRDIDVLREQEQAGGRRRCVLDMCDDESPESFMAEFLCVAESDRVEVWTVLY